MSTNKFLALVFAGAVLGAAVCAPSAAADTEFTVPVIAPQAVLAAGPSDDKPREVRSVRTVRTVKTVREVRKVGDR